MGNTDYWCGDLCGGEMPPEDEVLAKIIAKNNPVLLAGFLIDTHFKGSQFYDYQAILKRVRIQEIVPESMWCNVVKILAQYIALSEFNAYMELQFMKVWSDGQSYAAIKTAQYCESHNTQDGADIIKLQTFSLKEIAVTDCAKSAKEIAEVFYDSLVNFKSAMYGARKWIDDMSKVQNVLIPSKFNYYDIQLKDALSQWRTLFKCIDIPYARKEKACFNWYKIKPTNEHMIKFVGDKLTTKFNEIQQYFLR